MKILLLPLLLLLGSCNSFNKVFLTSYELSYQNTEDNSVVQIREKQNTPVQVKEVPIVKKEVVYRCERYILPELAEAPLFPLQTLNEIDPNNLKAIDKVLMDYIRKLMDHDRDLKRKINDSYNEYLKKC